MRNIFALCIIILIPCLLLIPAGCQRGTPNLVDVIAIFPAELEAPPPTSGWARPGAPANPYPENVQRVFNRGDKMYLGLVISSEAKTNVTFSRFTYFNKETKEEMEIDSQSELIKVWNPGQVDLLAFNNPWPIPEQLGEYEVRAYVNGYMAASAVFRVE